jgi:hypothetical protein
MWPEGGERIRIDWQVGSALVPPDRWFHQHFNTGTRPARYLALRRGGPARFQARTLKGATEISVKLGGNQIEYEDEDPMIRRIFEETLARNGVKSKMAQFFSR